MEAQGRRIRAESDGPGLGARFVFTLPVVRDADPVSSPGRSQGGGSSAGKILVVDDEPLVLRSVRDALSTAGFRAVATADPEEALALTAEHSPRLDLMLPEHDGEELMRDILAVSRIPVIFLSAYNRAEVVARVLEKGATDCIAKPFSPTEPVARVRAARRRFGEPAVPAPEEPFVLGDLTVDYARRRASAVRRMQGDKKERTHPRAVRVEVLEPPKRTGFQGKTSLQRRHTLFRPSMRTITRRPSSPAGPAWRSSPGRRRCRTTARPCRRSPRGRRTRPAHPRGLVRQP